jgi:uracil-DNA glycosylase
VVLLGRNPGNNEDKQNRPFIGRSGKALRLGYLAATEQNPSPLSLASIYYFNTVRCFTVADAEPNWKNHVKPCWPHTTTDLHEIIKCHKPTAVSLVSGISTVSVEPVPMPMTSMTKSTALSMRVAVVCLGKLASQAFVGLALHEPKPKSQGECFRNNAREVVWEGNKLFLLHTYHPAYYLRNPNSGQAIQSHMLMLTDWLRGNLAAPSQPRLIPPRPPQE